MSRVVTPTLPLDCCCRRDDGVGVRVTGQPREYIIEERPSGYMKMTGYSESVENVAAACK